MSRLSQGWIKPAALGAFLLVCMLPLAYAGSGVQKSSRVPKPNTNVTAGKGEKCVEDTEYMRKNHMKLLLHHRITAVHAGDNQKTDKYSIVNCVNCHASAKDNSVVGPGDFCQSCHAYAAVKITCFECHSSKPSGPPPAFHPAVSQGLLDKTTRATMMRYQAYHGRLPNLEAGFNARDVAGAIR
ncbi:MAG: hypothetical protein ACYCZH_11360 [Sulfuriferula sp.]